MTWRPIETAPRGIIIIVGPCDDGADEYDWCTAQFDHNRNTGHGWFQVCGGWISPQPTHWFDIPDVPRTLNKMKG